MQETAGITDRGQVIGALGETLDLVDFYASKLGDSSLPASGLTPLIDHLEDRLKMLEDMESAAEIPEKMSSVLSDLKITIGTEIAKFRRGDYL